MILKSMSRKSGNFRQLIDYITRDQAIVKNKDGSIFLFKHNLIGKTSEDFEKAFKDNDLNRVVTRKGSIRMYHEVISWRSGDRDKIDTNVAEQVAKKYAESRNDKAIYLGGLHKDKSHLHLHLMVSATEIYSGKSIRISKAEFAEIKKEVQQFEQERFGLVHSAVDHGKGERMKNEREYQMEERSGKQSKREEVKSILERCYTDALTQDEFYENVKNSNLQLYERDGKIAGVDDGLRHYRFSTLGYTEEKFEQLQEQEERMTSLHELRSDGGIMERELMSEEILDEIADETKKESEEQKGIEIRNRNR